MIQIDDFRIIKKDKMNWVLEEKYTPKIGKLKDTEQWKNIGYFTKLDQVCNFLFDRLVGAEDPTSLQTLSKLVKSSRNKIIKAVKEHCGDV